MKILGIDTSTKFLSITLTENEKVIFDYRYDAGRKHSVLLLGALERMLNRSNINIDNIGAFCVGLGPGSFTGMRISMSMAKAFSFGLGAGILGIPTLDVIAHNIKENGNISVISDARRGNVYSAFYKRENDKVRRLTPYLLLDFDNWLGMLNKKTFITGEAIAGNKDKLRACNNALCLPEEFWYPGGKNLNKLAYDRILSHGHDDIAKLNPMYLYPKECQIKPQIPQIKKSKNE